MLVTKTRQFGILNMKPKLLAPHNYSIAQKVMFLSNFDKIKKITSFLKEVKVVS